VRTNIDLDDALVERAIEELRGLGWDGNLDEMRADRLS
jgi:Arc/MetJ family transcription regulator